MNSLYCKPHYSYNINILHHLSAEDYFGPGRVLLRLSFPLLFLSSWLGCEFPTEGLQSAAVTIASALSANTHLLHIPSASQLPAVNALWTFLCFPPALLSKYLFWPMLTIAVLNSYNERHGEKGIKFFFGKPMA